MLNRILKDRSLWEAPIIDLWSIPHLLSGTLVAWVAVQLGVDLWIGLGVSIAIAVLWELFEKVTHLSDAEHKTNGPSDIVAAQIGYGLGAWVFSTYQGTSIDTIVFLGTAGVFVVVCILGWLSHHWYGKK